jgi:hypothetical protein
MSEQVKGGSYTMEATLCGDDGIVRGGSMHHGTDYPCTGHAHKYGEHIRCTSPAHDPVASGPVAVRSDDLGGPPWPDGLVAVLIRRPSPGPTAGVTIGLELAQAMEALGIGYGDEFVVSRR